MSDINDKPKIRAVMVKLDKELHVQAKIKSAITGIPMAVICRKALKAWVEQDSPGQEAQ